jgi:hypothetical protein
MSDDIRKTAEFDDVFVDRRGRVFQERSGICEELPRTRDEMNNCLVAIKVGGRYKKRFVNKLVIEAFGESIGLDPRMYHVMHRDGNRFNCNLDNLSLVKRAEGYRERKK